LTKSANCAVAAHFAPYASTTYVPPQPRLAALLELLHVNVSLAGGGDGSDDSDDDGSEGRDVDIALVLFTLSTFASHAPEQQHAALEGGAMEAVCAAMHAAPLWPRVQGAGCAALANLTRGDPEDTPAMLAAVARTAPRSVALHALRCLAGSGSECSGALYAVLNLLHPALIATPLRAAGVGAAHRRCSGAPGAQRVRRCCG
jgi:hypothetical protein